MLPDRSILIGQKLAKNAKIEKFKCDIFGDFQTLCRSINVLGAVPFAFAALVIACSVLTTVFAQTKKKISTKLAIVV